MHRQQRLRRPRRCLARSRRPGRGAGRGPRRPPRGLAPVPARPAHPARPAPIQRIENERRGGERGQKDGTRGEGRERPTRARRTDNGAPGPSSPRTRTWPTLAYLVFEGSRRLVLVHGAAQLGHVPAAVNLWSAVGRGAEIGAKSQSGGAVRKRAGGYASKCTVQRAPLSVTLPQP